jgi:DNA-binding CsgD family transcriptional regulator
MRVARNARIPGSRLWIAADPSGSERRQVVAMAHELTERERAAAIMLAYGHTNGDVARGLGVSLRTAEGERARLMRKLGFERRTQLVHWALERGFIH